MTRPPRVKPPRPAKIPVHRTVAHQVRIIGGQWKRTVLPVIEAEGLRPTPDRVRETVFNWLTHLFDGAWEQVACLDLFAGSGALGFEAASRGAASVLLVENHTPAVRQLEAVKEKLHASQVSIVRSDALAKAHALGGQQRFDLIFLDPPYQDGMLEKILPLCIPLLQRGGLVYAESAMQLAESSEAWLADWEVLRADKAGMVFFHLLRCRNDEETQA